MSKVSALSTLQTGASHAAVVQHYILHFRPGLHAEMAYFKNQPSFDLALHYGVRAENSGGKRFGHQRRLKRHVIPQALPLMLVSKTRLAQSTNFDSLYAQIDGVLSTIPNAGNLYKYDTALRLGAYLGLFPTRVFLQTGAYDGARRISRSFNERSVVLSRFPEPYHCLSPFEMKNLLCVYKKQVPSSEA